MSPSTARAGQAAARWRVRAKTTRSCPRAASALDDGAAEISGAAGDEHFHGVYAFASTPSRSSSVCSSGISARPAELVAEAARIAEQQRRVVRAVARRIDLHGDRHARARDQQVEQVAGSSMARPEQTL